VQVEDAVRRRVTNRRIYTGGKVSAETTAKLSAATCELAGVRTIWIESPSRIETLATLVGRADAVMFSESSMRRAFLANVRFDARREEEVAEGLSPASLELNGGQLAAFRTVARLPDSLLKMVRIGRVFAKHSRQLVKSASGLCLGVAPDHEPETDFSVGRAMQRAWLALAENGLAAQPMMSLPVLDNALQHGPPALVRALDAEKINHLLSRLRTEIPEIGAGRPAFLLRLGNAAAPSGRTGRLPLAAVAGVTDHGVDPNMVRN
jgi:hypothetical protein